MATGIGLAFLEEPARQLGTATWDRIAGFFKFRSNLKALEEENKKLVERRSDVEGRVEAAKKRGKFIRYEVVGWISDVKKFEDGVTSIRTQIEEIKNKANEGHHRSSCRLQYKLSREVVEKLAGVKMHMDAGNFGEDVAFENSSTERCELLPLPDHELQPTMLGKLDEIIKLLDNDKVEKIGIWGMGGVGKSSIVKSLNNKFAKNAEWMKSFDMVIFAQVPNNKDSSSSVDQKRFVVQKKIAKRLKLELENLDDNDMHIQILKSFAGVKRFLLILDDVWDKEAIDLCRLGVPQPLGEDHIHRGSKIILTSRLNEVCAMADDGGIVKVEALNDDEAWQLFRRKAAINNVATSKDIKSIAMDISKECSGLPLAISKVGEAMKGNKRVESWKDALKALRRSNPEGGGMKDVYESLKCSYDSLHGQHIKSCFLYCCLYPEIFPIDVGELVQYWFAEGLFDQHQNYLDLHDHGVSIVEELENACLLEPAGKDTVKLHDMIRHVGIWITSSSLEEGADCKSYVRSGIPYFSTDISKEELSDQPPDLKRVSFMHQKIRSLPADCVLLQQVTSLLLQGNTYLEIVPEQFLQGFPALRVLDLSETRIKSLPLSLLQLGHLQALLLRGCSFLEGLPNLQMGQLSGLQVLNCRSTAIKELPHGMENLTKLRKLDLFSTKQLQTIRAGIFSRLSNLELLDMRESACKWAINMNMITSSYEELLCLKRLIGLFIYFESIPCFASQDPAWIGRLQKFEFRIGPTVRLPGTSTDYKERHVLLRELSFSEKQIGWLFTNALSLEIYRCMELEKLALLIPGNVDCFESLKSLRIEKSQCKFQPGGARLGKPGNLEQLCLKEFEGLVSVSELADHLGLCFSQSQLVYIQVERCHELGYLLSVGGDPILRLEEICVSSCNELEELFKYDSNSSRQALDLDLDLVLPNLRVMKLKSLPKLERLCSQQVSSFQVQCLENLKVVGCNLFRELPLTTPSISDTIKQIKVERCHQLEYLLYVGGPILKLENIEEICVSSCDELEELFKYDSNSSRKALVLPNLRVMKLISLPKLKRLCSEQVSSFQVPFLNRFQVLGCDLFTKPQTLITKADRDFSHAF